MNIFSKSLITGAIVLLSSLAAAQAATFNFFDDSLGSEIDATIQIDSLGFVDAETGFEYSVTIDNNSDLIESTPNANRITGFAFDYDPIGAIIGIEDGTGFSYINDGAISGLSSFDVCFISGSGNNCNGGGNGGVAAGAELTFSFYADVEITAFYNPGLRVQTAGDGEGSLKLFGCVDGVDDGCGGGGDNPDGEIPLPAAGWMLLAGVGGLLAMRRRRGLA